MKRLKRRKHLIFLIGATLCLASFFLFITFFANPVASAVAIEVRPSSDGTSIQWTPSIAAAHYTLVDETPCNGSADYNSTNTVGARDSYNVNIDLVPNGSTITGITIDPCGSANTPPVKGDGGSAVLKYFYRYNSANNSADAGNDVLTGTTPGPLAGATFSGLSLIKASSTKLQVGAVLSANTRKGIGARLSRIVAQISYIPPVPTCTISANPSSVLSGGAVTLTKLSTYGDTATLNGTPTAVTGTLTFYPSTNTTYTMNVTGPGGTNSCSTIVTVAPPIPTCTIAASPSDVVSGGAVVLAKSSTNTDTATLNGMPTAISGTQTVNPATTTTYMMNVTGPGGTNSCSTTVLITAPTPPTPAPTCTISASPSPAASGVAVTLRESTTNATSATVNGTNTSLYSNGDATQTVIPTTNTTYTMNVTGPGGTNSCSTTVNIVAATPVPTCILSASPVTIVTGNSSTLTWSSTNGQTAMLNGGGTAPLANTTVSTSGSLTLTPGANTSYALSVTGAGGTGKCYTSVTVGPVIAPPSCRMTATPPNLVTGESNFLGWTSSGADTMTIDDVLMSSYAGTMTVTPLSIPTTYRGVVVGPGGTATCELIIAPL